MQSRFGLSCFLICALGLSLLSSAGCGGKYDLGQVEGTVTLDGKPLAEASVTFSPLNAGAESPGSSGITDSNGKYSLSLVVDETSGALVGKHQVVIAKNFTSSSDVATPQELANASLPAHDFTFEVKSGSNKADFNLETKKGKK
jgi:hypothetical protein